MFIAQNRPPTESI